MQVGTWLCSQCVHNMLGGSNNARASCASIRRSSGMLCMQLLAKDRRPEDAKLVHVRSSGLKAAATWHRVEILQVSGMQD